MFTSLVVGALEKLVDKSASQLWDNRERVGFYLKSLYFRRERVRFSISYLFRIQIPGSDFYLLVFNRRIKNQLQPVGGAYKRYGDDQLFESWGYQDDCRAHGLGKDPVSAGDLRFSVKGRYAVKVIEWFERGKEREFHGEREFIEELIEPGILTRSNFEKIRYRHVRRVAKQFVMSSFHQCREVLLYDIFELLPDAEQKSELTTLAKKGRGIHENFALVELEDIRSGRLVENQQQIALIGAHTAHLINQ